MDARKYWTMCRLHDWHYTHSDDPEVYRNGQENEDHLLRLAHGNDALTEVFKQWREYHYGNGARPAEPKVED